MDKVVIVNDACHVMETIIPYMKNTFDIEHIKRNRGLWDKTFGIMLKILKSNGSLYHVNYALQDAYLTSRFKNLDILHVHGSDVRTNLNNKWEWIAESNLNDAEIVLYSTPDLEDIIKEYRDDAIHFSNPIDMEMFYPKSDERYRENIKAVYWMNWYEEFPSELEDLLSEYDINLTIYKTQKISYAYMPVALRMYDIYIDRFAIHSISKASLEAMSCGLATIDYRHMNNFEKRVEELSNIKNVIAQGKSNIKYVERYHEASMIADRLMKIYFDII